MTLNETLDWLLTQFICSVNPSGTGPMVITALVGERSDMQVFFKIYITRTKELE